MRPTDFAKHISDFISKHLPSQGSSTNTISSYSCSFALLLGFMTETMHIRLEKLTIRDISKDTVCSFLDWLEDIRKCSASTRNLRLAAIQSFFAYLQREELGYMHECQKILSIRLKKPRKRSTDYLSVEEIRLLFGQPDQSAKKGRRDLALLSTLYETAARVQEIIDLSPSDIRLEKPPTVRITGKGEKTRIVPMLDSQLAILRNYMKETGLDKGNAGHLPLFSNSRRERLSRQGINHILKKYWSMAKRKNEALPPYKISCHSLRHSKAMHLLQGGVNLIYIRDILGHASVKTTEIYARADSRQKREALERAYITIVPEEGPIWAGNDDLISWLKSF